VHRDTVRPPLDGHEFTTTDARSGRLVERCAEGDTTAAPHEAEPAPKGKTALFNSWEDAVERAKCGGRMVRTGSCYTCRDCATNTGCS
jgi:hypothetical protein